MKRITKERIKRDMTQTDLAFELRIHPTQISKIENGKAKPFKPNQKKLEEYFSMNIDDLLQDIDQ